MLKKKKKKKENEMGSCSLYEYLYSYRKSKYDPIPKLTSNTTIEALKMIKRIKNEISSG